MPNGVICGGAVDGSNQLGGMVTCHAMTARPDGAGGPAVARPVPRSAPRATTAASNNPARVLCRRWILRDAMSAAMLVAAARRTAICRAEVRWHERILSSEQPNIATRSFPCCSRCLSTAAEAAAVWLWLRALQRDVFVRRQALPPTFSLAAVRRFLK